MRLVNKQNGGEVFVSAKFGEQLLKSGLWVRAEDVEKKKAAPKKKAAEGK